MDCHRLNAALCCYSQGHILLPWIDDLLDQLHGKQIFMMLDTKSGYWQIRMEEQSKQKIVLMMLEGLYKFHVMSYGLCNGPATFQRLVQQVLVGTSSFCNVYFDDILNLFQLS